MGPFFTVTFISARSSAMDAPKQCYRGVKFSAVLFEACVVTSLSLLFLVRLNGASLVTGNNYCNVLKL